MVGKECLPASPNAPAHCTHHSSCVLTWLHRSMPHTDILLTKPQMRVCNHSRIDSPDMTPSPGRCHHPPNWYSGMASHRLPVSGIIARTTHSSVALELELELGWWDRIIQPHQFLHASKEWFGYRNKTLGLRSRLNCSALPDSLALPSAGYTR